MSISTRNTNANYRPNFPRQQNVFQSNGPRNFKSEELFNINEGHNDSEPIRNEFEDRLVDYNEDLIEADKNDETRTISDDQNIRYPILKEFGIRKDFDFHVCIGYERFNVLLESDDFKALKAKIDYDNQTFEIGNCKILLYFELNPSNFIPFKQNGSSSINVPVKIEEGYVMIPEN
ncbi:hypothetical protein FQA39_LY19210 [Lamprigera yunnana]|nr:hypothetical protein FQA39_LY19210 [Lamprigera yunnana]